MEASARNRIRSDILHLSNVIGPRPAGSKEDDEALRVIKERFLALGLSCKVEEFDFTASLIEGWRLSAQGVEVPSIPCLSSPPSRGTISGEVADVGYGTEGELSEVEGKVILAKIGKVHESLKAESAAERGAVGAIFYAQEEMWGIYTGRLRYPKGSIPAFCVSARDGGRLAVLSRSGIKAELSVEARFNASKGKNLIAEVAGRTAESVVVTAHRDSRPHSPGANDNVSGDAVMLEVARRIANERLQRSVVLISTDAEEYGLCGSSHHVEALSARPEPYAAAVNLDSMGQGTMHVVERDRAGQLSPELNAMVTRIGRGLGHLVKRRSFRNGSDCDPFMMAGIPACWIRGFPSTSFNSTTDTFEKLDYRLLVEMAGLSRAVVREAADPRRWQPRKKS